MSAQPRNIILCFDGTSNEVTSTPTNVLRLTRCLVKDDTQIVFYAPGVGTLLDPYAITDFRKYFRKLWDLGTGFSLRESVIEGYAFVINNYRPGDSVHIFGFSRGAYAARAMVGMLNMFGQLRPESENMIPYLWQCYRNNIPRKRGVLPEHTKLFDNARLYMDMFSRSKPDKAGQPVPDGPLPVKFVGIFDTVSSYLSFQWWMLGLIIWAILHWGLQIDAVYGIPLWPLMLLANLAVLFRWLPYTSSLPNVEQVRHATALDEYRSFFPSNHVSGRDPKHVEVWFSGVHTDVGGGRPTDVSQLARVSLRWMLGEAAEFGVRLDTAEVRRQLAGADPLGPAGKSWAWYWMIAGLVPQLRLTYRKPAGRESGSAKSDSTDKQPEKTDYIKWYWPNFWRFRYIRKGDRIHRSVELRREAGLLKHPRLSGTSWDELQIIDNLPLDGIDD